MQRLEYSLQSTIVLVSSMMVMASGCLAIIYTRQTHVDEEHALRAKDGQLVSTASSVEMSNLTQLPSKGPMFAYDTLQRFVLQECKTLPLVSPRGLRSLDTRGLTTRTWSCM